MNKHCENEFDIFSSIGINNQPVLVLWVLYIAVRSKCSDILAVAPFVIKYLPDLFGSLIAVIIVEQRLFGKGKDKQEEIQYSCGFAAGWLPKS